MSLSPNDKRAHTGCEVKPMEAVTSLRKKKHDALKAKRNSLFAAYSKDPENFHLAREIKDIDDEIAESTQHVEQERRAESSARKLVSIPK
jgi:hypothetical protein